MTSSNTWRRVNRGRRCPICGRPEWCLIARDGTAAICPRIQSGRRVGEAGWLHRLQDSVTWQPMRQVVNPVNHEPVNGTPSDLAQRMADFQAAGKPDHLGRFALSLGLSVNSLTRLGIGWAAEYRAWAFPLVDARCKVRGIRLRSNTGFKWAVKGGREGLSIPTTPTSRDVPDLPQGSPLLICEGPTDTAALLDLGFESVVGRPNNSGGTKLLVELVKWVGRPDVVIVADGDEPGRRGADTLAAVLRAFVPSVRVIWPPEGIKDARAWLRSGGSRGDVEQAIGAAPVQRGVICPRNRR